MHQATQLDQIHETISTDPLSQEQLAEFYQNLNSVRDNVNPTEDLRLRLENKPTGSQQMLYYGPRGCGKSTELIKLQNDIEDDFLVVSFSVRKELDLVFLNYTELFILCIEKLLKTVEDYYIELNEDVVKQVSDWAQTEEIKKTWDFVGKAEAEANAEAGFSIPFLTKFFARLRASSSLSYNNRKTITEEVEKKLSDLISNSNLILNDVKAALPRLKKKGLLIIIEDLDKVQIDTAKKLFVDYGSVLTQLKTNVIFTFPIALRYNLAFNAINANYTFNFRLPMVKVRNKNGEENEAGIRCMTELVEKRMALNLFESPQILKDFILKTGGCTRDLFRLIDVASVNARIEKTESITAEHATRSVQRLKRDYDNSLADKMEGNNVIIPVTEYYETLVNVATSSTKKPDNDAPSLDLRHSLCILDYNGEGWSDVHPVVLDILVEREKINLNGAERVRL